jgi:hypothetical protein
MHFTPTPGDEPGFLIYIISRMDAFPDCDPGVMKNIVDP